MEAHSPLRSDSPFVSRLPHTPQDENGEDILYPANTNWGRLRFFHALGEGLVGIGRQIQEIWTRIVSCFSCCRRGEDSHVSNQGSPAPAPLTSSRVSVPSSSS